MTYIVGLTGGIGSGKTAVADLLGELGAAVVDTDAIAHELTGPGGAAMAPLREAFGAGVVAGSGALDRASVRRLVFADAAAKARLEAILHPMIRAESARRCAAARAPYVVLVVPLLVEAGGYRDGMRRIAVVDCPEELQLRRVVARSGLSEAEARAIMATQATRSQRLAVADDVIRNDGDLAELRAEVLRLHRTYLEMAGTS